jgi:tripeptidyl-peptidase-2
VGDIYPEAVDLRKGDYIIRLVLRHDDAALLSTLRALPLVLERKLDPPIAVPAYETAADSLAARQPVSKERALRPGERVGSGRGRDLLQPRRPLHRARPPAWGGRAHARASPNMSAGESAAFFLGPVPSDKLPKDAIPGRVLTGTLTLGLLAHKTEPAPQAAQVAGRRTATRVGYRHRVPRALAGPSLTAARGCASTVPAQIQYIVPPKKQEPPSATEADPGERAPPAAQLAEALRDARVKFLKARAPQGHGRGAPAASRGRA